MGSVSSDGELIVWDTATGRPLERWDTSTPWGVGFSPDGDLVYGGGADSMLRTWDLSVEDTYLQQTAQVGDGEAFAHADLSPDGQRVAYSWLDGGHGVGQVRRHRHRRSDAARARAGVRGPPLGQRHLASRGSAVHRYLSGHRVRGPGHGVLDPATGRVLKKRELSVDGGVDSIAYVDGDRSLLVGEPLPGGAGLGGPTSWTPSPCFPRAMASNFAAHVSTPIGDGSTAMVHENIGDGASGHWRLVDLNKQEVLVEGDVNMVAYTSAASPDGSTFAVAGDTGEIVTIDVSTGEEQRRSTSLGAPVLWLDYSDDGELLVSGADDGGVSLWDATTLDLLGTVYPPHHGDPVPAGAQFIGDSHDVAIASYDGTVYRWETDLDRAIDFACQMAGRNLTDEEWEEFLPAQPYQSVCPDE